MLSENELSRVLCLARSERLDGQKIRKWASVGRFPTPLIGSMS